jgi:glycosyltransferase involved in cell wall biosynthesis
MNNIVIFTDEFPSSFLENEIPFLAHKFDRIYVVAAVLKDIKSKHSDKVSFHRIKNCYDQAQIYKLLWKHLPSVLRIYLYSMCIPGNLFYYLRYYRSFLGHLLRELELVKPISKFILEHRLERALFYDYWLVNVTIALAELRRKNVITKVIARAHRFDLYDYIQYEKRLPFRDYRIKYLDAVFTISKEGYSFLKERVRDSEKDKIKLSYLGVNKPVAYPPATLSVNKTSFTLVSCARLVPQKRVDLIVDILQVVDISARWIHIGDGPGREILLNKAKDLPPNISFVHLGYLTNEEVYNFYSGNHIDLFISVSNSEGLPVSMMEAISFGIPVFACNANGVAEIVIEDAGTLVPVNATVELLRSELLNTLNRNFDRDEIKKHFDANFDAQKNYKSFIDQLVEIHEWL